MIQDISPKVFNNSYVKTKPKDNDIIIMFLNDSIYLNHDKSFVRYSELSDKSIDLYFCFSVDEDSVYITSDLNQNSYLAVHTKEIRYFEKSWMAFVGATALQIHSWLLNNMFCGKCGTIMFSSNKERAQICTNCSNIVYPKIQPAVIVLIKNGSKIIITKYTNKYTKIALVAGYCEIGETAEQTVSREVFEEVGLRVKNITYYKSQPWPFSSSLLLGYYCDLDGDDTITLDENELAEAIWVDKEDLPTTYDEISLTQQLIKAFKYDKL